MYVILGETGDSDYEELISGTHKTIIMKGIVSKGSEEKLRGSGSYQRNDIVPDESPLVACISEITEENIANVLKKLSKSQG
ncbi:Sucrose-phosphate synthase family protein [Trifolium repens]|jgi:sucrose-phosphate synthase|nr:Sucrose-phosphate synthase family protein [Trifolium repens]